MKNFFFFLKTPSKDDGGQDVFMRGMRIRANGFLRFTKKPVVGQAGGANP
jgi:hypothetical protein